jgi:hypothetical protein
MRGAESVLELLVDGQMERAWVLFAELLDAGANPPAGIYRRLLSGWVGPNAPRDMDAGERLDRAVAIVEVMRIAGHPLIAADYSALFRACLPLHREAPLTPFLQDYLDEAANLAPQLAEENVALWLAPRPYSPTRDLDPRLPIIEAQLLDSELRYDPVVFCDLMMVLCRGRQFGDAYRLLAMLRTTGVPVTIDMFNCLLEESTRDFGASKMALSTLRFDMVRQGVVPDEKSYRALLKCCHTIGDAVTAEELRKEAHMVGVGPGASSKV